MSPKAKFSEGEAFAFVIEEVFGIIDENDVNSFSLSSTFVAALARPKH